MPILARALLVVIAGIFCWAGIAGAADTVRGRLLCTATAEASALGGCWPQGGVIVDKNGAIYGTTWAGGDTIEGGNLYPGAGEVFQLAPPKDSSGIWTQTLLHAFVTGDSDEHDDRDGAHPAAGLAMDALGAIYGTTYASGQGEGGVFRLALQGNDWTESLIYEFSPLPGNVPPKGIVADGARPMAELTVGADGALYGTTSAGGFVYPNRTGAGTAFALLPPGKNETEWIERILYRFKYRDASGNLTGDGGVPVAGLIADASGTLYGTTSLGGAGDCDCGTVFALLPPAAGKNEWTERIIHSFRGGSDDGDHPMAGLTMDGKGVLYGTTRYGGATNSGTVFALVPTSADRTAYRTQILYAFKGSGDGAQPLGGVIMTPSGALYGTTMGGGASANCDGGCGTVFELSPSRTAGAAWTKRLLHSFNGIAKSATSGDGAFPVSGLAMDARGMLYGITPNGGEGSFTINPQSATNCDAGGGAPRGCGTVFTITP